MHGTCRVPVIMSHKLSLAWLFHEQLFQKQYKLVKNVVARRYAEDCKCLQCIAAVVASASTGKYTNWKLTFQIEHFCLRQWIVSTDNMSQKH